MKWLILYMSTIFFITAFLLLIPIFLSKLMKND